jgi:hypothetical protein
MCQKRERTCAVALQLREEALQEWASAENLHEVRVAWGRLGGRVVLHRYGRGHFSELARRRRAPHPGLRGDQHHGHRGDRQSG